MTTNRRLVLARRPHGLMAEGDVRVEEAALPDLEDGEALMKMSYLSIDPTVRTWVSEARSYFPPVEIGEVMRGWGTGHGRRLAEPTACPSATSCTRLLGLAGVRGDRQRRARSTRARAGHRCARRAGVFGTNGITAYFGMLDIGQPEAGQTVVVVSAAAGAVGSIAGQLARSRCVGSSGSPARDEKCAFVVRRVRLRRLHQLQARRLRGALEEPPPEWHRRLLRQRRRGDPRRGARAGWRSTPGSCCAARSPTTTPTDHPRARSTTISN